MVLNRTEIVREGKGLLPSHVNIDPPTDYKDMRRRKEILLKKYRQILGKLPKKCVLQPKEAYRRRFLDHIEVKLTYQSEVNDTVHAYLLIPTKREPPFAGIVAHHQCNIDCDWGKEAVVGKVLGRPDQSYGLDLVRRGFVVLVPDSKNCGERFVSGIREEGNKVPDEKWKHQHCWGALRQKLSTKHFYAKHLYDSIRAIDYLESLDGLVDSDRIGMIGHSLGAGTTFWTAAYDKRVKVAVASCHYLGGMNNRGWPLLYPKTPQNCGLWYHELIELIAPTPFMATRGTNEALQGGFQTKEHNLSVHRWAFSYSKYVYDLYNVGEDLIRTRIFNGGHEFPTKVRHESYEFIEKYLAKINDSIPVPH